MSFVVVFLSFALKPCHNIDQASATYGTRAKRGTWNNFQWHAEWIEIQYMISQKIEFLIK
jgi:hypothetical protein